MSIGVLAVGSFLFLSFLGLPLGFSFALVGFIGMFLLKGLLPALNLLGGNPYSQVASFVLCAVPLFVLMGQLAFYSGISRNLFDAAYKVLSRLPGGLAQATDNVAVVYDAFGWEPALLLRLARVQASPRQLRWGRLLTLK